MASSQLGLRCAALGQLSPVGMATTMAARRTLITPRASWVSPSYLGAVPSSKRFAHPNKAGNKAGAAPSPAVQRVQQQQEQRVTAALINAPLPGTLIPPPISQWPSGKAFFRFAFQVYKEKGRQWLQTTMITLSSRPNPWKFWKPGQFQLKSNAIPPTAKEMYADMLRAFAAGDREKLKAICTVTYLKPMLASLDKRPRTRRYKWELVRWTAAPRLVGQTISPTSAGGQSDMIRQATVLLSSRQRRVEYTWNAHERKWEVTSEKEADVTEHLIVVAIIYPVSFQQTEWRILSATRPSTVEEWESERAMIEKVQNVDLESYKL
ncbi:hypothetical protein QBC39DRAFT_293126 [Podospora conica]|nr:hypothetical protein QBC39DRAFT_293126 [Schizothecium conicum]